MYTFSSLIFCPVLADSLLWQSFVNSNFAGKAIVCILIAFSMFAWLIMLSKGAELKELNVSNSIVGSKLDKSDSVFDPIFRNKSLKGPYAYLIREALKAWDRSTQSEFTAEMFTVRMGRVENALQRAVAKQTMIYETKMVGLGSIISGAPFLGLLGTVWGVMDSFGAMGQEGASATLQALAPGVSGALLTTVAGLVVAIPSVFGYNYLLSTSRVMTLNLENFASALADRFELEAREKFSAAQVKYKSVLNPESESENSSSSLKAKISDIKFQLEDDIDD